MCTVADIADETIIVGDIVSCDPFGPFSESPRYNKCVLAVTDYFTKWVQIFPVPKETAATCVEVI